jgi:hypothetical protein
VPIKPLVCLNAIKSKTLSAQLYGNLFWKRTTGARLRSGKKCPPNQEKRAGVASVFFNICEQLVSCSSVRHLPDLTVFRRIENISPMNSLFVIAPYKYQGTWVFDDPAVGQGAVGQGAGSRELGDRTWRCKTSDTLFQRDWFNRSSS